MNEEDEKKLRHMVQGLDGEQLEKLKAMFSELEPIDYDAPGTTAREQGV